MYGMPFKFFSKADVYQKYQDQFSIPTNCVSFSVYALADEYLSDDTIIFKNSIQLI